MTSKFQLKCKSCNYIIEGFKEWFDHNQKCPKCSSNWALVEYSTDINKIKKLISSDETPESFFHYFDFLPLENKENIVTRGEGVIPVERWEFLEKYASEKCELNIKVQVYRNDKNPGTGTFKDVAAAMGASVLKENGITHYAVASTGNIATGYAHYLALAGISLAVFIPNDALKDSEAEISSYGHRVFRADGDYALAKKFAAEYNAKHGILLSGGNVDPARVEAKKTMVFEWLRQTGKLPDVYIQALSGGTGPIAIDKAVDDLAGTGLADKLPRFIMVQPDKCDPMTKGWEDAKAKGFPEGWEKQYPIIQDPETLVPTLATGNPGTYPIISSLVKKSNGEIIRFTEDEIYNIARLVAFEKVVKIGPASAIALGGFFESLKQGIIKDGETVMINVGESANRASAYMQKLIYTTKKVNSIDDCVPTDRMDYRDELWSKFDKYAK